MTPIRPFRASAAFALFSGIFALAAQAQEVSLEQAVERVQKETEGRVLAAEEIDVGRRKVYRIKVLTREGSVRRVLVSADAKEGDAGKNDKGGAAAKADKSGKGH